MPGRTGRRNALLCMALGTGTLCSLSCDTVVEVQGSVRAPAGGPIAEATVTLRSPGIPARSTKTGADGTFFIGIVNADAKNATIEFEKEGFQKVARSLGGRIESTLDVTLMPKTAH
jgi:hypothetical protein